MEHFKKPFDAVFSFLAYLKRRVKNPISMGDVITLNNYFTNFKKGFDFTSQPLTRIIDGTI